MFLSNKTQIQSQFNFQFDRMFMNRLINEIPVVNVKSEASTNCSFYN